MPFIVQSAAAPMPSSVKAPYRRVAVLRVVEGVESVSMISERARGVIEIVATWEKCHARGVDTAYGRASLEAQALADRLNKKEASNRKRREKRAALRAAASFDPSI